MFPADLGRATAGPPIGRQVFRRVLRFARPYRAMLSAFVATIVLAAIVQLAPPLLFRQIIDEAIPQSNLGLLHVLAALVVGAAVLDAVLSFGERWWSSRIGEGLIYDMRVMLFDHVQQMPMGFFTRSQTGALVSRLNNDVIGAQRALTGTLGAVVSNVIVLITTLVAMLILEWRLTLLALALLPVFVIPAKRVGRRLAAITREGMDLNASMNSTMTERFGVAGALLVKLFGSYRRETDAFSGRAARVRDIGVRSAVYSRTFLIALTLVAAIGTAQRDVLFPAEAGTAAAAVAGGHFDLHAINEHTSAPRGWPSGGAAAFRRERSRDGLRDRIRPRRRRGRRRPPARCS